MKYLPHTLIALLIAIQYPLWIGKGSWLRVWEVNKQLTQQKEKNAMLASRNAGLDADVRDLKEGLTAVEERARLELGMIKPGEAYYQIVDRTVSTAREAAPTNGQVGNAISAPNKSGAGK
jgi:cell division protein FtsB